MTDTEKHNLLLKSAAISQSLLDCFDEIEEAGLSRKAIKVFGKPYSNQVLIYLNRIFDEAKKSNSQDDYREAGQYIVEKSREIDNIFK